MRDPARHVDEGEVAELAIGPVEARRELGREFEHQARALAGDLPEPRIGHFGDLRCHAGANPRTAARLIVKQAHLAEELALVQVRQHHLITVLVLDHDLDRARRDVVQTVR